MALNTGTRLGPYEIVALVGADPTGEVYKAVDTRRDLTVAIKTLPPQWAVDPAARARLEQDALAVAQLKHPHICSLHDVGRERPAAVVDGSTEGESPAAQPTPSDTDTPAPPVSPDEEIDFLVLEYLEGQTLAQRLDRGALPLREAVTIAIAIVDALDAAHRKGILHRDLRPSNVMLTKEGGVKLLNCGLAEPPHVPLQGVSPLARTMAGEGTDVAMVAATLEYAAPEQLEGMTSDPRSDLFSLGVLLYEMVTGAKAFQGKNQTLLIAAIVSLDLEPLSKLRPGTPLALDHVVDRCLEKNPEERWQTAHDLGVQLRWIAEGGAVLPSATERWDRLARVGLAAALVMATVASVSAVFYIMRADTAEPFQFRVPVYGISPSDIALSPDGETIAVIARPDPPEAAALYVRSVRTPAFRRIAGTEDATQPFWSPDSRSIGFVAGNRLKRVNAAGGAPQNVAEVAGFMGGAWGNDGMILYGTAKGLFRVSAEGGSTQVVTKVSGAESGHYWPAIRPGGRHFTYLAWSAKPSDRAIFAGTFGAKEPKKLLAAGSNALHAPGYVLYHRDATLFAQAFDDGALEVTGEPLHIVDELSFNSTNGRGAFDVSQNGSLLYYQGQGGPSGRAGVNPGVQFGWRDRSGGQLGAAGDPGTYGDIDLSPDGRLLAVTRQEAGTPGADIWIVDWQRGASSRLTLDPGDDINPVWSHDGERVAFTTFRKGNADIYVKNANGVGPETPLLDTPSSESIEDWSKDGRFIAYKLNRESFEDIYALPLTGNDRKPFPVVQGPYHKDEAQFSYDGRYLAYVSDESGTFQVYVIEFPSGKERQQVSTIGGGQPRWDETGRRLFFRAPDNTIHEVDLALGPRIEATPPRRLFAVPAQASAQDQTRHQMSVTRDGNRFLTRYPNTGAFGAVPVARSGGAQVAFNFTPAQGGQPLTLVGRGQAVTNNPPLGLTVIRQWPALFRKAAQ